MAQPANLVQGRFILTNLKDFITPKDREHKIDIAETVKIEAIEKNTTRISIARTHDVIDYLFISSECEWLLPHEWINLISFTIGGGVINSLDNVLLFVLNKLNKLQNYEYNFLDCKFLCSDSIPLISYTYNESLINLDIADQTIVLQNKMSKNKKILKETTYYTPLQIYFPNDLSILIAEYAIELQSLIGNNYWGKKAYYLSSQIRRDLCTLARAHKILNTHHVSEKAIRKFTIDEKYCRTKFMEYEPFTQVWISQVRYIAQIIIYVSKINNFDTPIRNVNISINNNATHDIIDNIHVLSFCNYNDLYNENEISKSIDLLKQKLNIEVDLNQLDDIDDYEIHICVISIQMLAFTGGMGAIVRDCDIKNN